MTKTTLEAFHAWVASCPMTNLPDDAHPLPITWDAAWHAGRAALLAEQALQGGQTDPASLQLAPTGTTANATCAQSQPAVSFQANVQPWMTACFGPEISANRIERNHRFFEEATELVQAGGMTCSDAHQLVDYTFNRPVGDPVQEVGGVMVTLAAWCLAHALDMRAAGDLELARIWTKVEAIRSKQAAKPKFGPLPMSSASADTATDASRYRYIRDCRVDDEEVGAVELAAGMLGTFDRASACARFDAYIDAARKNI